MLAYGQTTLLGISCASLEIALGHSFAPWGGALDVITLRQMSLWLTP